MSLINQVLKDLDKRGARTDIGEATIRVVYGRSGPSALLLVLLGAAGAVAVGAAVWWLWLRPDMLPASTVSSPVPAQVAAQQAPAAVVEPAPQALVPLPPAPPQMMIEGITPDVVASGKPQRITIHGRNFASGVSVILRNPKGEVFANRTLREQSETTLSLQANFGRTPGQWVVELRDVDGKQLIEHVLDVLPLPASPRERAATQSAAVPVAPRVAAKIPDGINKQPTQISAQQQAENEYRRAEQSLHQGRMSEAQAGYERALQLYPAHEAARQSLVSLLLEQKRINDAAHQLQAALHYNSQHTGFAMQLARLQVEQGNIGLALDTLQKALPYADKQPDYLAFAGALLQRQSRHAEAVVQYQKALQLRPQAGVWQMGLGISLRAEQRNAEAREAFQHALDSNSLNAELQSYVRQQMKDL